MSPGRILFRCFGFFWQANNDPLRWSACIACACLIGIDLSTVGVALAQERAATIGMGDRTGFQVGDLAATSLVDGSCDAAMSLDVLLFVPDQAAPLREVARILRADGLFALTSWEQSGYSARLGALQVADYRPLLDAAGFAAEVYEEPPDWQRHQRALVEGIIAAEMELADEFGMAAAARYLAMARGGWRPQSITQSTPPRHRRRLR